MTPRSSLVAVWALLMLCVAGCSGGLRSSAPAEQIYVLRPVPGPAPATARVEVTLQLLRPLAQPGLDTARIALLRSGNRLDYFAGGRWAGSLPEVVQSLLAQSLRQSGRFAQVSTDAAGMAPDFVLAVTVRHFEAWYDAGDGVPAAHVMLECTLSSRHEHRQVASFDVAAQVPADANRLGAVVAALERAAREATAGVS